ncbi:DUF262 domain-containing protein [Bacillus cereus group sp. Bce039]|uniref:DUF262 domain-containing protein n=1 Tax=Bacillus cereus group TaxID=86661 RepID=UPI000C28BF26|nr:DUF262 domain-containing protein [Bacillus cereus]HDR6266614.1 DUF262 domain-containing protein [Bacillus cereus]
MNSVNLDFLIEKEEVGIEDRSSIKINEKNNDLISLNNLLSGSAFLSSIRKPIYQRKISWGMSTIMKYLEGVIEGDTVVIVNVLKLNDDKVLIIDGAHRLSTLIGWVNDDYGDGTLSIEYNNITEEDKQNAEQIRSYINDRIGSYEEKKHTKKIEEIKIHLNYIDKLNESELSRIFRGINQGSIVKVEEVKEKEVFFAFLDILGFKDLVNNNSNKDLIDLYSKIIDGSVENALSKGQINIDENGNANPNLDYASVNTLVISDSILLWTNHDHPWDFMDLILVVREVLYNSMKAGIPLRGAIAKGPLVTQKHDKSKGDILIHRFTVVGKALVEAYKKEAIQEWSGCLIDEECINSLSNSVISNNLDILLNKNILIKYKVPYKLGNIKEEYVLNWVGEKMTTKTVRESFSKYNKGVNNWAVESKIKNTLEFLTYVQSLQRSMSSKNNKLV